MLKRFLVLVTVSVCVFGVNLPSNFKKCKRNDSNFKSCLKDAIQDALPKMEKGLSNFNIPSLQPLEIPSMSIGEGTGPVSVVQNYKNVKINNIFQSIIDNVDIKVGDDKLDIIMDLTMPDIKLEAEYDFNGRVLLLPIVGHGPASSVFTNIKTHFEVHGELKEKNGEKYATVKTSLTLDPEKILFKFDNLFEGDERLGNEMNNLLNDNWQEIWKDVKSGYEEFMAVVVQDVANKIFTRVSIDKLFPL